MHVRRSRNTCAAENQTAHTTESKKMLADASTVATTTQRPYGQNTTFVHASVLSTPDNCLNCLISPVIVLYAPLLHVHDCEAPVHVANVGRHNDLVQGKHIHLGTLGPENISIESNCSHMWPLLSRADAAALDTCVRRHGAEITWQSRTKHLS
jgi:hypothetical protein